VFPEVHAVTCSLRNLHVMVPQGWGSLLGSRSLFRAGATDRRRCAGRPTRAEQLV